ncbi:MAG: helix-turn-helix domain-containing protein [Thermoguttaceae bacterium]
MRQHTPQYRSETEAYTADSCVPLRDAAQRGAITLHNLVHDHYPGDILPRNTLPGLLSVGYWSAEKPQDWGLDWHRNEGLELTYLKNGSETFHTVSGSHVLRPNDFAICGPWQRHRLGDPNIGVGTLQWIILDQRIRNASQQWSYPNWILLTKDDRDELTNALLYNPTPVYPATAKMTQCWEQLYRAVRDNQQTSHVSTIAIVINELLLALLQHFRTHSAEAKPQDVPQLPPAQRAVRLFLDELQKTPTLLEYPWSIEKMARRCHMSTSRFTLCCRQLTNLSPVGFLNQCRVKEAMRLMNESPSKTITTVAMECGFTTSQYFATVFKKVTGQTPKEFLAATRLVNAKSPPTT